VQDVQEFFWEVLALQQQSAATQLNFVATVVALSITHAT
jgi:hypothetical protein